MTPETHYAMSGDVNITYQVIGNGPAAERLVLVGRNAGSGRFATVAAGQLLPILVTFEFRHERS